MFGKVQSTTSTHVRIKELDRSKECPIDFVCSPTPRPAEAELLVF